VQFGKNFLCCYSPSVTFVAALGLFEKFFHLLFVYDAFLPFDTILSGTDNSRIHTVLLWFPLARPSLQST